MEKVPKPSNSVCNTTSSEPFRIYLYNWYGPGIYPSFRKLERLKIQPANPKGFSTKTPFNSQRTSKIVQRSSSQGHLSGTEFFLRAETDPVSEMSCFLFSRIPDDRKSPKIQ
jgi:hypothetical protein